MKALEDDVIRYFEESARIKTEFVRAEAGRLIEAARAVGRALLDGRKVLFFGNGGSACDASHLAAEFVNRFRRDRPALAALALNTDVAVMTSHANDYSYDTIFSRQIEALAAPGDVAVGITTSGASKNVLRALEAARRKGLTIVVLTGEKGRNLAPKGDFVFVVPSEDTPRIQECHITIGHVICGLVEDMVTPPDENGSP